MKRDEKGRFAKLYNGFKGYFKIGKILKCRDMIYSLGKLFTKKTKLRDLEPCTDKGFHYCQVAVAVWNYYPPSPFTVYSTVKAWTACHDETYSKSITNSLKVGYKLYSPYEYARTFFDKHTTTGFDLFVSGYCYIGSSVAIGRGDYQCVEGPAHAITTAACYSMAKGQTAYALGAFSFAQGRVFAAAPEGSAEANVAIGRKHVKTGRNGAAIGIETWGPHASVLSGGLGAHLVFLVRKTYSDPAVSAVKVFKVDGKEVKANIPYQYDVDQDKLVPWEGEM